MVFRNGVDSSKQNVHQNYFLDMMEVMEKRHSSKNRKPPKQPANDEAIDDILIETIPWQAVPHQKRTLPDSVIDPVINRAAEVIGDRQEAMRWLGTPIRGLDFATPISLLATEEGQMRVNDILGQMEHGIW